MGLPTPFGLTVATMAVLFTGCGSDPIGPPPAPVVDPLGAEHIGDQVQPDVVDAETLLLLMTCKPLEVVFCERSPIAF